MEFWGVEIKPGKPLKVTPEEDYLIHISQASLGESKKGNESVPLFVKVGDQKLVLGTLSTEKLPQISFDLVFDQDFELSHNWKNGSVFILGYKAPNTMDGGDEDIYSDFDDSEDEDLPVAPTENGKPKANLVKAETKPKAKAVEVKKDESDSEDDDESDEDGGEESDDESDSEEVGMDEDDSEDGESDEEDEDDEETPKKAAPKKVEQGKKRPNDSETKTPVQAKKAKTASPQKTDGKKGGHTATPHPAKAGKKAEQSPKASGQLSCGSCKKSFNSEVGLQSHNKAKHGAK